MTLSTSIPEQNLAELADFARHADEAPVWPAASWQRVGSLGGFKWSIPKKFGGDELAGPDLLARYESLAGACLTSCFILTQRDGACARLYASGKSALCEQLFPGLVAGDTFLTVGIAQLTTSRQHGKPAVVARMEKGVIIIDGVIPWVTGAPRAEHLIAGAVLENMEQILVVLPTDLPGVSIGPPLELAALEGSLTAEVRCDNFRLPERWLLAGPAKAVLQGERGGTGGLETSCLGLGLGGCAIRYLADESQRRPDLAPFAQKLDKDHADLRRRLYELAKGGAQAEAVQKLRSQVNALVLRATQSALAASKGAGFLREHPVQRWARQALFFLVWSCPWPVTAATLRELAALD